MTLLAVVRDVCATVGVQVPQTVFGGIANNRTMQEMLALANEMAQRIAYDTRDWTVLRSGGAFTGDGITDGFALPASYKRLLLTTNVRRKSSPVMPLRFISDLDEWLNLRLSNTESSSGDWIINAGKMYFSPILPLGEVVVFSYLDKNCVTLASGGFGDSFMADTDSFRLNERLLKLGMVWQWKAQKGSPYAEDMGSYSDALANEMGHDQPAPILIDRSPLSHTRRIGYPWPLSP
jgi:hypothetical protein